MSKVFDFNNIHEGSYIDGISGVQGTNTNGVFRTTSKGLAWKGNGSTNIAYGASMGLSLNDFTVVCNFKLLTSGINHLLFAWGEDSAGKRRSIWVNSVNVLYWSGYGGSANLSSGVTLDVGKWYQAIISITDADVVTIYVNNPTLVRATASVTLATPATNTLYIGANPVGGESATAYIQTLQVYSGILPTQERNNLYNEFLQSKPKGRKIVNPIAYDRQKPTKVLTANVSHAYTFKRGSSLDVKGTLHGTFSGGQTPILSGRKFHGVDGKFAMGAVGNIKGFSCRIKLDTTTEQILEGAANAKLILANAGTIEYAEFDNCYINGVDTDTITAGVWHTLEITSTTDVDMTACTLALNNASYGAFEIEELYFYTEERTLAEIVKYSNDFANQLTFKSNTLGQAVGNAPDQWQGIGVTGGVPNIVWDEWVVELGNIYTSDFSAGADGFPASANITVTGNVDNITDDSGRTEDDCLQLTDTTAVGVAHYTKKTIAGLTKWDYITTSFDYYIPTANTTLVKLYVEYGGVPDVPFNIVGVQGAWTRISANLTKVTADVGLTIFPSASGSTTYTGTEESFYIKNISIDFAPPLPNFNSGTKYHLCNVADAYAIPSTQAYGKWRMWFYKADTTTTQDCIFIANIQGDIGTTGLNGYMVRFGTDEKFYVYVVTNGAVGAAVITSGSVYTINTLYEVEVTRTTAGVFVMSLIGGSVTTKTSLGTGTDTTYSEGKYITQANRAVGDMLLLTEGKKGVEQ
jgi:hypothetical protein